MAGPTKQRILREAMRLFGEKGFGPTTINDIEQAAGLSPGSGAVYRHFASKQAILDEGVQAQIETNAALLQSLGGPADSSAPLGVQLRTTGQAGLKRLERERDLNRLVLRDLRDHPHLLRAVRDREMAPVRRALVGWLESHGGDDLDCEALAAVIMGATSHYWALRDVFGRHPSGVSAERYVAALADLAEALLVRNTREDASDG